jgi:hypothetical protein
MRSKIKNKKKLKSTKCGHGILLVIPGPDDYMLSTSLPTKTLTCPLPIRPGHEDMLTDMLERPCDRATEEIGNDVMRRKGKLTLAAAISSP